MRPVNFKQVNKLYGGRNATAENPMEIIEMPVYSDGREIISCWRLTEAEIREVMETGLIWFRVHLPECPPIWPQVENPFVS